MKKIKNARIIAMLDALHETKTENQKIQQLQKSCGKNFSPWWVREENKICNKGQYKLPFILL